MKFPAFKKQVNHVLESIKELVKTEFRIEKNKTSSTDCTQFDLYNKEGERVYIIQQTRYDSKFWTTELNGSLVTDGQLFAMPKGAGLDEAYLLLGRKLGLI